MSDNRHNILQGRALACIRGDRPIFSNLTFTLPAGRAVILQGTNGSGKSSLLKIIAGLLPPQNGDIFFGSEPILGNTDWISHNICYLAHKNGLKAELTIAENLTFWANIEQHNADIRQQATKIGINHCLDLPVCYLSSGQARRAALTRILCHPEKIWLLDEPTVGLDKAGVSLLANLMNDHLHRGGRILAATHTELGLDPDKTSVLNMADFTPQASNILEEGFRC